jgi:hypothetical protein
MTVYPEDYQEDEAERYQGAQWQAQPLTAVKPTERHAPEYGACMTWNIPQVGVGQPVQILQRQPQRYKAKMVLIALTGATSVVINSKLDPVQGATPQGVTLLAAGPLPDWESQQPLYAIAVGGTATISVWDETYAVR